MQLVMMMMQKSRVLLLVVGILVMVFKSGQSINFELETGRTKCFSEDIKNNSLSVGKYGIVNEGLPLPHDHRMSIRVMSSSGKSYHYDEKVEYGQFAFTTEEIGDYSSCFWIDDHEPSFNVTMFFEWGTGIAARDWGFVAKKDHVQDVKTELKMLMLTVDSIHEEMYYLRDRESEMQDLNKSTTAKMFYFSFISLFICMSVAGLQFWHLKNYFERKKLL